MAVSQTTPTLASPGGPNSPWQLFTAFTMIALQGFGGVMAIVQRELVDKRQWLTQQEFVEDWAVAQIMPGANVVNLSINLGDRYFGWRGALAAMTGMLLLPMIVVLALALLYTHWANLPAVAGAVRGMSAVAAGLVAGTACKMARSLGHHTLHWRICLAITVCTLAALTWLHWPLAVVLLGIGGLSYVLTYRKLAPLVTPHAAQAPGEQT